MNVKDSAQNRFVKGRPTLGLALASIWAYFSAVFLVGEPSLPFAIGLWLWLLSIVVFLLIGNLLSAWVVRSKVLPAAQLVNFSLFGVMLIVCLGVLDITYSMYINSMASGVDSTRSRLFDENVWAGELYPKIYYPTERNFAVHKPNVTVSGNLFGNFYSESMLDSPTLVSSVLKKYPITIRINELGFRDSNKIDDVEIFSLGDSFTFGWGVNASESWSGLLESGIGRPIYNLGIHDASPKQELELLKYLLEQQGANIRIRRLLWMIYEGNDLEDDYSEVVQRHDTPATVSLTKGTLIEAMERLLRTIKRQSVIHRLRQGAVKWKTQTDDESVDPYSVDGVSLVYPLYYSEQLGPRLFSGWYTDLAGESASYVENHWNRAALEAVFRDMKSLAIEYDFEVAVIMAPSASRLHGPYFESFPEISGRPHFLDFVSDLADSANFETVNLYELLQPHAGTELLYFRDDDHFNHRGNALAAELIQQELFTKQD